MLNFYGLCDGRLGAVVQVGIVAALLCLLPGQPAVAADEPENAQRNTVLTFAVTSTAGEEPSAEQRERLVKIVRRRLAAAGFGDTQVGSPADDQLELTILSVDPQVVQRQVRLATRPGSFEFAILANKRDHAELIEKAMGIDRDLRADDGQLLAGWRPAIRANGQPGDLGPHGEVVARRVKRDGQNVQEYLVVFGPEERRVTADHLAEAKRVRGDNGQTAVSFRLNRQGAELMERLTGENQPTSDNFARRLGILIDDRIHSAPLLRARISGRGEITGRFTEQEVDDLVIALQSGGLGLQIALEPVERTIESR